MRTPSGTGRRVPPLLATLLTLCGAAAAQERRVADVPFVPTSPETVEAMLDAARPAPGETVYDLGSGDGRIVIAAARRPGVRGVGVELDARLVRESEAAALRAGVADRVRFVREDLFRTDLRDADVVTLFLLPSLNLRLRPRLLRQLRPGARVVSHAFAMGDWEPDSTVAVRPEGGGPGPTVYLWTVPADVRGSWTLAAPDGRRYRLRLEQRFQRVRGTAAMAGRTIPLADVRLAGDRIALTLADTVAGRASPLRLEGRVRDGRMAGSGADGKGWSATRLAPRAGRR
ncbi:MAG TPA: class I SAM-dependent methyltransferase [Longimicrobiaceae bacterium]|nr:class I SAM-dependent methyltransferase [Longimicrobiaceae bacterium]